MGCQAHFCASASPCSVCSQIFSGWLGDIQMPGTHNPATILQQQSSSEVVALSYNRQNFEMCLPHSFSTCPSASSAAGYHLKNGLKKSGEKAGRSCFGSGWNSRSLSQQECVGVVGTTCCVSGGLGQGSNPEAACFYSLSLEVYNLPPPQPQPHATHQ